MARGIVQTLVYVGTRDMKEAIEHYATDCHGSPIDIVIDAWRRMLASGDFSLAVATLYEKASDTGLSAKKNQTLRRFSFSMPLELVLEVDTAIAEYKAQHEEAVINRSLFNQEALRRYVEPKLIALGYLTERQFKDKKQAAKNIAYFRGWLGLTKKDFCAKYITLDGSPVLSYPQYANIERSGKGNIERVLEVLKHTACMNNDLFYEPTDKFRQYLEEKKVLFS